MIYICSDIHGLYGRYSRLLDTIRLREQDTLYVLGDMIDRGPDGIEILLDMMKHPNIVPFMGNHEHMMLMYLFGYDKNAWMLDCNGGKVTLEKFRYLSDDDKRAVLTYLNEAYILKNLEVCGRRYSLSHIGIIRSEEDLQAGFIDGTDVYMLQKMVWGMHPYGLDQISSFPEQLCPTTFLTGHIVTRRYLGSLDDDIVTADFANGCRYVDLDCGCALGENEGALACVALDEETGLIDYDGALYIR